MDVAEYTRALIDLLPKGPAWQVEQGTVLRKLLTGIAEELARVDARAADLVDEWDPRTTVELLGEWERVFGLPDGCTDPASSAMAQRRAALVARIVALGGQSRAYFIGLAAAMGYAITITEFRPFTVASTCEKRLQGNAWAHAWQVNAPLNTVGMFTVADRVSEPLAWWGNDILECVISRLKPGHTQVLFSYS